MASAYVEDIARFQAHRFAGGIAPIKAICRVSSAAAQLLAIPKQQLYKRSSGGEDAGAAMCLLLRQALCRKVHHQGGLIVTCTPAGSCRRQRRPVPGCTGR